MADKIDGLTEAMEQFNPQPPTLDTSGVQVASGGMEEFQQLVTQIKAAFTKLGDYIADAQQGFQTYKDISTGAARLYLAHNDSAAIALAKTTEVDAPVLRGPTQHVLPFGGK
jgi:hypothetical protein